MWNLHIIPETFSGFFVEFLDIIIIISFLSGIFTIIAKNPIVSVLYLILLFSSIACYLIFINIKFIGISYLLVYVGAVSILFLFILMLINIRVSELINDTNNNIPLGVLAILILFIPLSNLLPDNKILLSKDGMDINSVITNIINKEPLLYVSSYSWDGVIVDISDIASIGNIMYTSYSMWLILTSVILLLAMVGSIVITIKQKY
jgi:NADH-ubiquinone oxidoreductase chain 6